MQYKIIVDKQPSSNPSAEKKEYIIDIEELRVKGNVYDSLNIEIDKTYVTRRLALSEYGVLSVLDEPKIEELTDIDIQLFEGDNYIYLMDMQGNKFYAEYLIKNDFNDIYATKNEMNSAITQTAQSIELSVNQKLTGYATNEDLEEQVTELNSTISQTASEINLEVSKKIDDEELTGANITLRINNDTSEATINADKIELSANDILNILAGNTINLTSKDIVIQSNNFNVDKNGNMSCTNATINGAITSNNATITGGKIKVSGAKSTTDLLRVESSTSSSVFSYIQPIGAGFVNGSGSHAIYIMADDSISMIDIYDSNGTTSLAGAGITTPKLTQTSLESIKKNITKFAKNATDIINNSDIYEYNLKSDADTDKKMIGFVIGDNYKTPDEVIDKDGQAVELYSAIGILWKGFQERQSKIDKIDKLEERILQLEKEAQHD